MPISKPFKFLLLWCLSLCGFWIGFLHPDSAAVSADLSSEVQKKSINSYDNLPCPTPEKYKELAQRVHLVIPAGTNQCDNSKKAILGKVLLLMDGLQVNPPAEWLPETQADLKSLLDYVGRNSVKLELDLTQMNSIAFNISEDKEIYLGGYFFESPPLEGIANLIHEARHSIRTSDRHMTCTMGDIPLRDGGCDGQFSTSLKDAGSYSYEVLQQTLLGLYGVGLLQSDREYLYSSALSILVSRINEVPPELAKKEDVLVTMDKKGQLFSVDIKNNTFIPLQLSFKDKEERPVRIDFSPRNSGVLIFTNKLHLYLWTYKDGLTPFFPLIFPEDQIVYDFGRGYIPGGFRHLYMLKTAPQQYKTVQLSSKTLKMVLVDLAKPEKQRQSPNFHRFFIGMFGETAFLTQEGRLYLISHDPYPDKLFAETEGLQDPRGWVQGTGGVLYHDLFLLNSVGELKMAVAKYHEDENDKAYSTYSLTEKDFRIPGRATKYFQGMKYHAQLNDMGEIYVRGYDSDKQYKVTGQDIVDFTIIHNPSFTSKIVPTYKLPKPKK